LRVPGKPTTDIPIFVDDSSALVSQRDDATALASQETGVTSVNIVIS